ncbi:unnamed protein product [Cochlearia groenlandica]
MSSLFSGSFKLAPQKQGAVDKMRRLADFKGLFDDEKEAEFLAEEEAEGMETDEEGGSPLVQTGPIADPPLPAGSPPADVAPPPPSEVLTENVRASVEATRTTGVKRTREEARESSAELPQATRLRTEGTSVESRAGSDEQGVVVDQVAGLGSEEAGRSALDADPSQADRCFGGQVLPRASCLGEATVRRAPKELDEAVDEEMAEDEAAGNEAAEDEVVEDEEARDANLPEESETVRRGE